MIAGSITLLILSLLLPFNGYGFAEADASAKKTGIENDSPVMALEYSNERPVKNQIENASIRRYRIKDHTQLNGVALVIHGLNCRPEKMASIIARLTAAGIECLNLSLRGHGENYAHLANTASAAARLEAFKSVTYPLWKTEAYRAYRLVKKRSNRYATPLFFVGFSMGGLLGVDLLTSHPNVQFDKMVLFAPALTMRKRNSLLKIFSPFPGLVVPSIAHRSYLTNRGTPMAAYNALFDMNQDFENNFDPEKINVPTVVFIDEHDELISFSGLQKMIREQNLDQWKIHPVKKDKTVTEIKMHHLIIDETAVGKMMWQEIVKTTIAHFLGGQKE